MKVLLVIALAIVVTIVIVFFYLGYVSQSGKIIGLVEGRLAPCQAKPNCVCSEHLVDTEHFIEPIVLPSQIDVKSIVILKSVIDSMGGVIKHEEQSYIAATFTSNLYRFVDDLEIRIDSENKQIHFRSASRVGYSDVGVNRKRVELLKQLFNAQLIP